MFIAYQAEGGLGLGPPLEIEKQKKNNKIKGHQSKH